jgi:Na+-driven multidrug efflux pump
MILVGQNVGAGKIRRAEQAGWMTTGIFAAIAAVGACFMFFLGGPLMRCFTKDPEVIAAGVGFLKWTAFSIVFLSPSTVLGRAMNGAGDTFWPMLVTFLTMLLLRVPLAYGLAHVWHSVGVWVALAASEVLQGGIIAIAYHWGRWKIIGRRQVAAVLETET